MLTGAICLWIWNSPPGFLATASGPAFEGGFVPCASGNGKLAKPWRSLEIIKNNKK